jgi:hypothetical protein
MYPRRKKFYFLVQQQPSAADTKRVGPGLTARGMRFQAENEINTARRLLKLGFAPVDWLYSESLTKNTKKQAK